MIFINARFLTQHLTGVQRFALELCNELNKMRNDLIFLVHSRDEILDQSILNNFNIIEVKGGKGHYWEQITLPRYLKKNGTPLLINLCSTAPTHYKNQIVTHHDVTYVRYPESFSFKFRMLYKFLIPRMLDSSKKIITVSEFSKTEVADIYGVSKGKFEIIYNAVNSDFVTKSDNVKKEFCLAVSSPNVHKNFQRMIEAFLASNTNLELYIIGGQAASFSNIQYQSNPRIKFLGRINDDQLIELYQTAAFFIFPSLYEGFGIPPLEAQACGCPVIASHAASIPEVLGNSALYFDPYKIEEMKNTIKIIAQDQMLREKLAHLGFENVKRFSWYKSATQLNKLIQEVN